MAFDGHLNSTLQIATQGTLGPRVRAEAKKYAQIVYILLAGGAQIKLQGASGPGILGKKGNPVRNPPHSVHAVCSLQGPGKHILVQDMRPRETFALTMFSDQHSFFFSMNPGCDSKTHHTKSSFMEFLEGRVFGKVNILDKVKGNLFRKPCKLLHFFKAQFPDSTTVTERSQGIYLFCVLFGISRIRSVIRDLRWQAPVLHKDSREGEAISGSHGAETTMNISCNPAQCILHQRMLGKPEFELKLSEVISIMLLVKMLAFRQSAVCRLLSAD